jgi:hypothetical protein
MIGWSVVWKCFVACLLRELLQQPTWPHVKHKRSCTQSEDSSQPFGVFALIFWFTCLRWTSFCVIIGRQKNILLNIWSWYAQRDKSNFKGDGPRLMYKTIYRSICSLTGSLMDIACLWLFRADLAHLRWSSLLLLYLLIAYYDGSGYLGLLLRSTNGYVLKKPF